MSSDWVARLDHVTKRYATTHRAARWRAAVPGTSDAAGSYRVVLDDVDLTVGRGEALGVIGPNGAGKSTALKVLAGVTRPSSGRATVRGTLRSMIELGAGFHPDLTGWENAMASLVMHGSRRRDIPAALGEIADFAGIVDAMGDPLRHFSLGMQARLAFAVATHTRPDLLIVDEVLAVGDRDFQLRCIDRIAGMVEAGTGLVFVSHEMPLVAHVCSRVVHVRLGRIVDEGDPVRVVERYLTRASSRYPTEASLGVDIQRCETSAAIEPFGSYRVALDLEVRTPLREPKIGVDMSLPAVAPDLVSMSSLSVVDGLRRPGRYRVEGSSRPLGFENADLRAVISVIDGVEVADRAVRDLRLGGGRRTAQPEVSVEPHIVVEPIEPIPEAQAAERQPRRLVDDPVLRIEGLTKTFRSGSRRFDPRRAAPGRLGAVTGDIVALDDVSLAIGRGESVGIIGANGSGKSTLLRVCAGLSRADRGAVTASGSMVPMLGPAAGLHPLLTGRENIDRLGSLLGMRSRETTRVTSFVEDLTQLGDAIDAPVRTYSTGMRMRLGAAVALARPADVLLIDEVLAVGDEDFRRAVVEHVSALTREGTTVLFVSHELRLVEQLCDRVVRLDHGRLVDDGSAAEVVDAYGGSSWGGGVHDATSGVRLLPLVARQRQVPVGGRLELTGVLVVDTPSTSSRLELSFRALYGDRPDDPDDEYRRRATFLRRTLVPAGDVLAGAGSYRYVLTIDRNEFAGRFDAVVAVVDERDDTIRAETWQELMVGDDRPEGFPGPILSMEWTVTGPA